MAEEFLPIIDEQDYTGETAMFILSSNAESDPEILHWHLENKASVSITADGCRLETKGLSCLHAAIASLRPRFLESTLSWSDTVRPGQRSQIKDPSHECEGYSEDHRSRQKRKIELLIEYGADLHAPSVRYGTPTDLARLTGNFDFWFEILQSRGINTKEFLAKDKLFTRDEPFTRSKAFAKQRKRDRRSAQREWLNILAALEDFRKAGHASRHSAISGACSWRHPACLMGIGSYEATLTLIKEFMETAFPTTANSRLERQLFQGLSFSAVLRDMYDGRYYQSYFFEGDRSYVHEWHGPGSSQFQWIRDFLETFATIASGDSNARETSWDWESYDKALRVLTAAAHLHLDIAFRFPSLCHDWDDDVFIATAGKMPGAWPDD